MTEAVGTEGAMRRNLGLVSATTLIVGSAIGSGIFLLPSRMGADVGSPGMLMAVWVVGGILTLFGALTFAEMAAMYPRAGGMYVFIREAFNEKVAFLFGWTQFWVIQTGIIAAVATAFALFVRVLFPMSDFAMRMVAVSCILFLSLVNYAGVKYGGLVQNVFTALKVGAIAALVVAAFALVDAPQDVASFAGEVPAAGLVGGFGLALLASFFAYDGWAQASYVAAEVKDPQRTVPRAMFLGVFVVMAVYVAATAAFLYVLPFDQVTGTSTLAADAMGAVIPSWGPLFITVAIVVSTFGTVNAFILSGPRIYYALAKDGYFYRGFTSLHPRFGTPDFATIMQAQWACLLVLTGTYNDLVNYATFAMWAFYGIAGVGFFVLRKKAAHVPRPYRTWGYPVVPVLFVLTSVYIVVNTLVFDFANAGMGLLLILTGLPFLWWGARRGGGARTVPVMGRAEAPEARK